MSVISRATIGLAMLAVFFAAEAQFYPAKSVRFLVPFAPGGPSDIVARVLSQKLSAAWSQPVIVENRAGASGNIGTALAAKAAADGYTVLVTTSAFAVNPSLWKEPGYAAEDFVPVVNVASSPNILVTNADGPRTLQEAILRAKAKPITYGSAGSGTTPHLSAEYLFKVLAKVNATHVPYKGAGPALAAALSGEVDLVSVTISAATPLVRSGRLRGLAVTSSTRVAALPDVPTVIEAGFAGFDDYTWVGVFLPKGTSQTVVARLNADINGLLRQPEVENRLEAVGFQPTGGTSEAFFRYLHQEIRKWSEVVRQTGAQPD
ncbi:MAG: tripartite tricarboxylate transporter substrate binding protein [Burkholderiales bacterium]